jgi:hypothetical protein
LSSDLPVVGLRRAGQDRDPGHPAPGAPFPPSGGWDPSWLGTVVPPAPAHSGTNLDPVPEVHRKCIHCEKRLATFPSPAGMSLTKLSLGGNN